MTKIINAVAAIIYHGDEFLIMKKKGEWTGWQFVQGGIDPGETAEQAVLREIKEETGLADVEIAKKLELKSDYWFLWEGEKVHKFMTFFLIRANKKDKILLSEEHSDSKWCRYEETSKEITFNKELFKKAYEELKKIK